MAVHEGDNHENDPFGRNFFPPVLTLAIEGLSLQAAMDSHSIANMLRSREVFSQCIFHHWNDRAREVVTQCNVSSNKDFSSNLGVRKAQRFYNLILLPWVKEAFKRTKGFILPSIMH